MITVYRDADANAIFVESELGGKFLNSLQAYLSSNGNVSIRDVSRSTPAADFEEFTDIDYTEFEDAVGDPWGANATEVINNLNSIFQAVGSSGNIPSITSPLTINAVDGDPINYELTSDYGVAHEWTGGLPTGLVTVDGNVRKVVGSLSIGVYTPTMRAVNYFGEDSQTLTINVSAPPFSNTKSVRFNQNDYADAVANTSNPLYRVNDAGATPWSIACWVKPNTSNQVQTILSFGGDDLNNEGRVILYYRGGSSNRFLRMSYGTSFNYLEFDTAANTLPINTWTHVLVTYDGGTTDNGSGGLATSYSRFSFYIDGALVATTNSHNNYGFSGEVKDEFFRLGRKINSGNYMRGVKLDEVALWASDEGANAATIYNAGTPHDLSALGSAPDHWWRMGDGDTFPTLSDNIGSLDFTMINMTGADIVNDTPI